MTEPPHLSDEVFAKGLREAITARGLSLERLRAHLAQRGHHVSVATLSYWQTARSRPDRAASLAALASLEEILDLEHGALASLLRPRRRRTPITLVPTSSPSRPAVGYDERLQEAAAQLGLDWGDDPTRVSIHDLVEIDEARLCRSMRGREILVAHNTTVTRFPICALREDTSTRYRIVGHRNCTVTNVVPIDGEPVAVVELTLTHPLTPGQALAVEYQMDLQGGQAPMTQHLRASHSPVRELYMEIRFAGESLPRSAEQFLIVGEKRRTAPLLLRGPTLNVRCSDFGPGLAGVEWTW